MVSHEIVVRGGGASAATAPPLILQRVEDNVVPALLDDLADAGGLASVAEQVATSRDASGTLSLFQPVHRTFHVALLEVVCATPGYPRLDPARIDSAGMVIRRRALDESGRPSPDALEAWMQEAPTPRSRQVGAASRRGTRGWVALAGQADAAGVDADRDPDPRRRPPELRLGRPELELRHALTGDAVALAEEVTPLFVAPPDVCRATGRTLLFGIVPVTSTEMSRAPEPLQPFDPADLVEHLPQLLKAGPAAALPHAGHYVSFADAARSDLATADPALARFVQQLRQLAVELDLFGTGSAARALRAEVNAIQLPVLDGTRWPESQTASGIASYNAVLASDRAGGRHDLPAGVSYRPAADFLEEALAVLVAPADPAAAGSIRMPIAWPQLGTAQAQRILRLVQASLQARLPAVLPRTGRYADASRQYRLRAFVRLKDTGECGCCARLIWSPYSEPFTIAPWFAPSDAAFPVIPMPDLTSREALRALRPNISFAVPKNLMGVLQSDPKKMLAGEGGAGGMTLDWVCSFSIPIITFCAFIVLNIFLSLFDLIFHWLLFIKICLPIPRPK